MIVAVYKPAVSQTIKGFLRRHPDVAGGKRYTLAGSGTAEAVACAQMIDHALAHWVRTVFRLRSASDVTARGQEHGYQDSPLK